MIARMEVARANTSQAHSVGPSVNSWKPPSAARTMGIVGWSFQLVTLISEVRVRPRATPGPIQ